MFGVSSTTQTSLSRKAVAEGDAMTADLSYLEILSHGVRQSLNGKTLHVLTKTMRTPKGCHGTQT